MKTNNLIFLTRQKANNSPNQKTNPTFLQLVKKNCVIAAQQLGHLKGGGGNNAIAGDPVTVR